MTKACFVAIVKNEENCIRRCLESVRYICSSYIISDTGSTDGTIELIRKTGEEFGMTGVILENQWVNYSYNRNIVMEAAHKTDAEYIFWNDADDYFVNKEGNLPTEEDAKEMFEELDSKKEPIIAISMRYCGSQYKRMCILRNNQLYVWKSPKHEYLTATVDNSQGFYAGITNQGSLEGHARKDPDRQKRDVKLFVDYIYENGGPKNCSREVFYLAQEYSCFDTENAILHYKLYLELARTFIQEKYVTYIRLYGLTKELHYLELAINLIPRRLEAYYELVKYNNDTKNYSKALEYINLASELREPHQDDMFSNIEVYHVLFDLECGVTFYWLGKIGSAYEINIKTLNRNVNRKYNSLIQLEKNIEFCKTLLGLVL